jgi:hypothetical protein
LNITGKVNKIKMATESCPDTPSKWGADVILDGEEYKVTKEDARAARIAARQKRIERRQDRQQSQAEGEPGLTITNRNGISIGHVMRDMWPTAGFLVGGGPSLNSLDSSIFTQRGVVSLGINNVAGWIPTTAFICGDDPKKFHHGIFFDGSIIKFVPSRLLRKPVRAKKHDGTFANTKLTVRDCPMVFGYNRAKVSRWIPDEFLTLPYATWGRSDQVAKKEGKPHLLFSLFLGLRMMHYLGVRRVYLVGVDFEMTSEDGYAFPQYRWPSAIRTNNNSYQLANEMCHELLPHFDAAEYSIFNCNQDSRLTAFPYVPIEDAVEDCRGLVPLGDLDLENWYAKTPEHYRPQ